MKSLIIKNIPSDVHKAFKMACLANDKDMRQVIVEFMEKYAQEKKKK